MSSDEPEEISTHVPATARITVQQGCSAGRVFEDVPLPTVVGRSKTANIQLEDDPQSPTISRRHVLLGLRGGRLAVQDLSTNGTRVGSSQLAPGETVTLTGDTPIWLGQATMITVEVLWPEGSPPPDSTVPVETDMTLALRTLGALDVTINGALVPPAAWQTRKALALLTYLALRSGTPQDPQRLCEAVWPESEGGTRATLQSTVSRLRKALRTAEPQAPDPILLVRNLYSLSPRLRVQADSRDFEDLCRQARQTPEAARVPLLEHAVQLYRGPFLEGYTEEWIELHRTLLQRLYLEALEALSSRYEDQGRWDDAARQYQRILQVDTCREAAHAGLIRCLVAAGQREEAVRQYLECSRLLKKHLDLSPSAELQELYRGLVTGC